MAKSIRTIISKLGSACSSSMERRRSVKMPMRYADSASGAERVEAIANSQHSTDPILRFHTIIIQILHQTTTERILYKNFVQLYLIKNLHQTTTSNFRTRASQSCILSKIYIKPQRNKRPRIQMPVVSYQKSTSNHNIRVQNRLYFGVVSYQKSTSNHNVIGRRCRDRGVVSYQKSTSNHNKPSAQVIQR